MDMIPIEYKLFSCETVRRVPEEKKRNGRCVHQAHDTTPATVVVGVLPQLLRGARCEEGQRTAGTDIEKGGREGYMK